MPSTQMFGKKKVTLKMMKENDKTDSLPEAALIDIKQMNERIDCMKSEEVNEHLVRYNILPKGELDTRKEKLKNIYKTLTSSTVNYSVSHQLLPYYIVIDFEATCEEPTPSNYRPEIIEFGAVIVSSQAQKIIDCFQMYCKPQINPILSEYCQKLTGITQERVDSAETFDVVLKCFHSWIKENKLKKYGVVTDGPWDTARYLFNQCHFSHVPYPTWGRKWINIKSVFRSFYKWSYPHETQKLCLTSMLEILNMEFIGRPHCGLDDAKNIARVLLMLIYDGAVIHFNEKLKYRNNSGPGNNDKGWNADYFNPEFSLTKDKNIVRAQFTSIRGYSQPSRNYFKCRREKDKEQTFLAVKMSDPSNPFPSRLTSAYTAK